MDSTLGETAMARMKGLDSTIRHNDYKKNTNTSIVSDKNTKVKDTKIELLQE